jgi:hypothetical protein
MGSGSGGQAAMIVVWVVLAVLVVGGFAASWLLRRRRGRQAGADKAGRDAELQRADDRRGQPPLDRGVRTWQ